MLRHSGALPPRELNVAAFGYGQVPMTATGGPTARRDPPALTLAWDQVAAWRLQRHHLDRRAARSQALQVVADIAGLHAQVMSSAELTLWARVGDLEPDAVRRALWAERTLVKTWAMRGTLHLLPADELPLWQAALSTPAPTSAPSGCATSGSPGRNWPTRWPG